MGKWTTVDRGDTFPQPDTTPNPRQVRTLMAALNAGRLLARRYRLLDRIGAGGMSVIWRARDEVLDRVVAIKVLAPSLAADAAVPGHGPRGGPCRRPTGPPARDPVHDYGETVAPDGEITSFVVMELLSRRGAGARLTEGPLPWPEAVEVGAQVAEALAAAHRLGIVHRDITPANVMMTRTGAKVLDFGIATQIGTPDEDEDGETFGTPAYVAPERLDGAPAQPSTDVYSLGVLLLRDVHRPGPVPGGHLGAARRRAWSTSHRRRWTALPGLPPLVVDICLRCLARDPAERPTAHQVATALRDQLLPGDPQAATMLAPTVTLPALATAGADATGTGARTTATGRVTADAGTGPATGVGTASGTAAVPAARPATAPAPDGSVPSAPREARRRAAARQAADRQRTGPQRTAAQESTAQAADPTSRSCRRRAGRWWRWALWWCSLSRRSSCSRRSWSRVPTPRRPPGRPRPRRPSRRRRAPNRRRTHLGTGPQESHHDAAHRPAHSPPPPPRAAGRAAAG